MGESDRRFEIIDALRGLAAVGILLYHLYEMPPQRSVLHDALPGFVGFLAKVGSDGVPVFFVISGFVIAWSTGNLGDRWRDGARFSLRRQVRLDPPYYVVMAAVLAMGVVEGLMPGLTHRSFSALDIVLNMFYLQEIFHAPSVLRVAWTLCLEVQFYLVVTLLIVGLGALRSRARSGSAAVSGRRDVSIVVIALMGVSLLTPFVGLSSGRWFLGPWWMFALGMVACWTMTGVVRMRVTVVCLAVVGAVLLARDVTGAVDDPWGSQWAAWGTVVLLVVLVATRRISQPMPSTLLYLGSISYSLYLVHLPVIDVVMGAGSKAFGDSPAGAVSSCVVAAVAAFLVAVPVRRLVEIPAMRASARLRTGPLSIARLRRGLATAIGERRRS